MISWFEKHNKTSLIITILIAIFIFYISSLTFAAVVPGPEFKYKPIIYHFLIFLLFSFFLLIALLKGEKINLFLLAIIISIIYAISDEFHQLFVPGRYCSLSDVLTDSAGILFAGLLYTIRIKFKNKTLQDIEEYDSSLYY
jgi:VanZ family protein